MSSSLPTEQELHNRMVNHLGWWKKSDQAVLLWQGYLSALLEWGLIDANVHDRLCKILPNLALLEHTELMIGERASSELMEEILALQNAPSKFGK